MTDINLTEEQLRMANENVLVELHTEVMKQLLSYGLRVVQVMSVSDMHKQLCSFVEVLDKPEHEKFIRDTHVLNWYHVCDEFEFACDMCSGETECDEECRCDSCNEINAENYYNGMMDTYD